MLMTEFHGTETVNLTPPAADVFALLVDVGRMTEWNQHLHHVVEAPGGPLAEGAEWVLEMRAMVSAVVPAPYASTPTRWCSSTTR